ncbi:transcription factor SRM1-like [Impatiens glandulifera]|uniref:transcription factor SRM1-like n=1 Tax=Impatiens glandulifera TaxID=253017 RepID=UPI001FB07809|nr:transcription factor SRM1-like [Impatiens glandulifera]
MTGDDEDGDTSLSSSWNREQDKAFENALATYPEEDGNNEEERWEKIAADVPGKSLEEVKHHYEILMDDVIRIESGVVPLPIYECSKDGSVVDPRPSKVDQDRRKGIAWTEDEHRLFLLGLDKYGKGDWRSISRNFVISRTPTQVASHAQKYFIRLNSMNKERRRSSIHDITSVDNNGEVISGPAAASSTQQSDVATIEQPVVGMPVNHMAYGVGAPVSAVRSRNNNNNPHSRR